MSHSILPQIVTNEDGMMIFEFGDHQFRAATDHSDGPIFVMQDACDMLGIQNVSQAKKQLDDDEIITGHYTTYGSAGQRPNLWINESGLYHLIFVSRKPIARKFRRYVTGVILPSIRQQGGFIAPNATDEQIEQLRKDLDRVTEQLAFQRRQNADMVTAVTKWVRPTFAAMTAPNDD